MKVLVTGATGYIGTAVCEEVRKAGHQVVGLARNEERAKLVESRGHLACAGDLEDVASLRAAVDGVDAVIHTAMRFDAQAGERDKRAVETMLDALTGSGRPFIYSSGVWVMGDTDGSMKGEVSGLRPPPMVAWRPAVEELVLAGKERGVEAMVLRPGMVFGRKGGALGGMFGYAREHGKVRIVGRGLNCWSTVHIDDLADLYARAIGQPAGGQLFIACGGMPQPVERIGRAVAAACGLGEGEEVLERISLEEARAVLGPVAECLVMDCRAGSTKAARYFGWTVRKPSIFDEIFRGSYLS